MLNLMVQVVARPRPQARHISCGAGWVIYPAEPLVQGILGGGILPVVGERVRHLLEEPVLVVVALTDGVGDVVGEQIAVAQTPAPQPVIGAVALVELAGGAIGIADFPDLLAIADRLPVEFAQIQVLARFDGDVGLGVFAEHSVGKRVERVRAGADVGDGEFAVLGAVGPELIVIPIVRPGYRRAVARPQLKRASITLVIRVSQADGQMREFLGSRLGVIEDELSGDIAALPLSAGSPRR